MLFLFLSLLNESFAPWRRPVRSPTGWCWSWLPFGDFGSLLVLLVLVCLELDRLELLCLDLGISVGSRDVRPDVLGRRSGWASRPSRSQ